MKTITRIKFRIWEKKDGIYAKTLAKIQVTAIFLDKIYGEAFPQ